MKKTTEDPRPAIDTMVARIEANPKYHALKRKRNGFGWMLTVLMLVVYYGYIALIAFNKPFLAQPIGAGVTTLGIPIGMGVSSSPSSSPESTCAVPTASTTV